MPAKITRADAILTLILSLATTAAAIACAFLSQWGFCISEVHFGSIAIALIAVFISAALCAITGSSREDDEGFVTAMYLLSGAASFLETIVCAVILAHLLAVAFLYLTKETLSWLDMGIIAAGAIAVVLVLCNMITDFICLKKARAAMKTDSFAATDESDVTRNQPC